MAMEHKCLNADADARNAFHQNTPYSIRCEGRNVALNCLMHTKRANSVRIRRMEKSLWHKMFRMRLTFRPASV